MATKSRIKVRNRIEQDFMDSVEVKLKFIGYNDIIWVRKSQSFGSSGVSLCWFWKKSPYKVQINITKAIGCDLDWLYNSCSTRLTPINRDDILEELLK